MYRTGPSSARTGFGRMIDIGSSLCIGVLIFAVPLASVLVACGALLWLSTAGSRDPRESASPR